MGNLAEKESCTGCYACTDICPRDAVGMEMDEEGFYQPHIDKEKCVNCRLCEKVCPVLGQDSESYHMPFKAYAAWINDREILERSSSGGAFSALAERILQQEGTVYGAAFQEGFRVKHIRASNRKELEALRKAKYLQSDMKGIYRLLKEDVLSGRKVLFSGTPCQVEAAERFLGGKYSNLILVEFICHGVPSEDIFRRSLRNLGKRFGSPVKEYEFHSKRRSWRSNTVSIKLEDGRKKELTSFENPFMLGFFHKLILRKSCYECKFKKAGRVSDIVLADFWEIKKIAPRFDNYHGVSMVVTMSDAGQALVMSAKDSLDLHEVDCEKVIKIKKHFTACNYDKDKRTKFFQYQKKYGYDKAEKKLTPHWYKREIKRVKDLIFCKLRWK